ncbi:hypothetical protein ACFLT7_07735 [candidate division KSB1 bacterium]
MFDSIEFILGIAVGIAIGIAVGKKRKPWSEMSPGEKKLIIAALTVGVLMLVLGVVVFFIFKARVSG